MIFLTTKPYKDLRDAILGNSAEGTHVGGVYKEEVESITFPDGERYQCILPDVQDEHVVILGGTISDEETMAIYDLAGAVVENGAKSLTLLCPYFGYSTMERAVKRGEVVTANSRARLLSSIPQTPNGNRIALLDLHTEGLPYYFHDSLRAYHLYGKPVIVAAIKEMAMDSNYVLASTDAGRAKWVESLANELHVPSACVLKRRVSGSETVVSDVSADVEGKRVILYDDMIRTGGSLMGAAWAYKAAGASSVCAVTTHGIFPGDSIKKLYESGLFTSLVCTDSHPNASVAQQKLGQTDFLKIVTIAPVFRQFLYHHTNRE